MGGDQDSHALGLHDGAQQAHDLLGRLGVELAASAGLTCETGDYTLPQLYTAEEAFVTGTMGGLAPVVSVDGRTIGDGIPGPVTKRLTALFADLTATTGTPVT